MHIGAICINVSTLRSLQDMHTLRLMDCRDMKAFDVKGPTDFMNDYGHFDQETCPERRCIRRKKVVSHITRLDTT